MRAFRPLRPRGRTYDPRAALPDQARGPSARIRTVPPRREPSGLGRRVPPHRAPAGRPTPVLRRRSPCHPPGVVAVPRAGSSARDAIEIILRLLAQGAVVGIFAEGRVSHAEAQLAPFRRGVGYLAIKAQVPAVPVWLRGTAELYLGRELVARAGAAYAAPAIEPTKSATTALADELHARLASLATPWIEPDGVRKRWRWMTDIL